MDNYSILIVAFVKILLRASSSCFIMCGTAVVHISVLLQFIVEVSKILEFPQGCQQYNGPHDLECYQSIWKLQGCTDAGESYPDNSEIVRLAGYYQLNLR